MDDAESFIKGENNFVSSLGQRETNMDNIEGQFIGLIKLSNKGCEDFISAYNKCANDSYCSDKSWGSNRKLKLAYMTDLLNFFAKKNMLNFIEIERGWIEIDDLNDLEIANKTKWI